MRATLAVASEPAARSILRMLAASGGSAGAGAPAAGRPVRPAPACVVMC